MVKFQLEAMNILETRAHKINDEDRISVIKNWLGLEGLLLMETFMQEEKEKCKTTKGLFSILSNRFKLCHNHILLSYNTRNCKERAMSLPRTGWADCEQK